MLWRTFWRHNVRLGILFDIVIYLPWCTLLSRSRRGLRGIVFTLSVCLSVCMCVCPANVLIFYFSAIRIDIDLKCIQNTYMVVPNSHTNIDLHMSKVKVTGTIHCFLKVQSYHQNWGLEQFNFLFKDTSYNALCDETINTGASREMTWQKRRQYFTSACITPIPKLLFLLKSSTKIEKIQPVLLIFPISVPNLVTIGHYLMSFLTCVTFSM